MMDETGRARLWNYQEGIMGLIIESITRMLRGEQGKAALAALASDLAANAARAGVERLAAARGEDNTLVRAGRKGQAGLETLAHTNHARFEFESANSTGGWFGNHLLQTGYEMARQVTSADRHDAKASEPPPKDCQQERGSVAWARKTLGVGPRASPADIKAAHLRLINLLHPDKGGFNEDAADLNDARRVLLKS